MIEFLLLLILPRLRMIPKRNIGIICRKDIKINQIVTWAAAEKVFL